MPRGILAACCYMHGLDLTSKHNLTLTGWIWMWNVFLLVVLKELATMFDPG